MTQFSRGDLLSFCVAARSKSRMTTPTFPSTQFHTATDPSWVPGNRAIHGRLRALHTLRCARMKKLTTEHTEDTEIGRRGWILESARRQGRCTRQPPGAICAFSTKSWVDKIISFGGVTTLCTENRRGRKSYPPNLRALRVLRGKTRSRSRSKSTTEGSRDSRRTRVWEVGPAGRRDCEIHYLRSARRIYGRIMGGRIISWGGHAYFGCSYAALGAPRLKSEGDENRDKRQKADLSLRRPSRTTRHSRLDDRCPLGYLGDKTRH